MNIKLINQLKRHQKKDAQTIHKNSKLRYTYKRKKLHKLRSNYVAWYDRYMKRIEILEKRNTFVNCTDVSTF